VIKLETNRLIIRNWEDRDRALFHEINSDDEVMEYFDYRRSRTESDATMEQWRTSITNTGYGFTAVELKASGECLGTCGMNFLTIPPLFPQGTVEIGWRFAKRYWGKGYVTEAAEALLSDGFTRRGLSEVVAVAVPANLRSTNVMDRLGMTLDLNAYFDHPRVSNASPHLKRHATYRVNKSEWERGKHAPT
jgi:RimJ/RimL family protein N-acetyltransferase